MDDLHTRSGERWPHGFLFERTWQLRSTVRACDACYLALAGALGATLLTPDCRLAAAPGVRCPIECPPG